MGKCGSASGFVCNVPTEILLLSHDWKKKAELPVNVMFASRTSNLESGDAFYVVSLESGSFLLVIFQMTVGDSHPVKVNGLREILLAFPESVRSKITRKYLVFVIPQHGTLNEVQKLVTQKREEAKVVPRIVEGFQQYVYRHIV